MTTSEVVHILVSIKDVLLGLAGGLVAYLFDYTKAKREGDDKFTFMVSSMVINMVLGAFVAYTTGTILSSDVTYRDAIIGLSGVTAYNILLLAESRVTIWLIDRIDRVIGKGKK